jgi:hypothetical protein
MSFAGHSTKVLNLRARALKEREAWMNFVATDPALHALRSEPQSSSLLQQTRSVSGQPR